LSDFVDRFVACFNDRTRLAIVTQASNVDGIVLPLSEIVARAREMGIRVLVDGAQSVGWLSREHLCCGVDYFAASLHKGLRGPFGLGVLVVGRDDAALLPLKDGGTGLETLNPLPQSVIPHGLETGTINIAAVAGAIPAFEYALTEYAQASMRDVIHLFCTVLDELSMLTHIRAFGPAGKDLMVPVVSLQHRHINSNTFARILDREYGILARAGLHCAPLRHCELGTTPDGTVRISFGHSTTEEDANALVQALKDLDKEEL
jgi:selenocysteine lyase/cysteine desulfurase